ncbi:MAG: helicase C-terminal domain-containing protein [Pirellulaceae bacterium]
MLSSLNILGPEGRIAARLDNYEHRPQQLEMSQAVGEALADGHHLVVEAGTGVGKSFSYLVPAILAATEVEPEEETRIRRIVISTHTITLQEQLLNKDIPLLNSVIPREFSAILVKGRGNYISLRRMEAAVHRQTNLFDRQSDLDELDRIQAWSKETTDGSRSDLDFGPQPAVWDEVVSDSSNCMGRHCPRFRDCFYFAARRRMENAQLLIVNHALFFSDLALRRQGVSILPDYDAVIIDEAHTVENVAADHLGLNITAGQVRYNLNRLYNDRSNKGLLVHLGLRDAQQEVFMCQMAADEFFADLFSWREEHAGDNGRVDTPRQFTNRLSPALSKLATTIRRYGEESDDPAGRQDLASMHQRLSVMADSIDQWNRHDLPGMVYWVETTTGRRRRRITLSAAPVDIGPVMRSELYDKVRTVVMTSATLSTGPEPSFDFFRSRIGLTATETMRLGSPFRYRDQVQLVLVQGMPDPGQDRDNHLKASIEMVKRYVGQSDGHAFVLLTSYDAIRTMASSLEPWLVAQDLQLISQSDGTPRQRMIEQFKQNPRSVLLGTDSFWYGVDIPGDALQNVIIPKLPFGVPDQPLLEARLARIRENGGNPFMDYQLPEAVLKFRQGFGRLIRSQNDYGMVVILDPRIRTKPYGRAFLDSLPGCELVEDRYDL